MLILSLPLLGLGSKSTSLSPGFCVCRPRQYHTICWKLNLISGFFVASGYFFGRMESINLAGVFQEAGDADSRARTRSEVSVEYLIFPYTSTFIRLSHLYQEFCVHCIVIVNDGRMGWVGVVDSHQGVGRGTRGGFYLIVSCLFVLLSFGVSCPVSF